MCHKMNANSVFQTAENKLEKSHLLVTYLLGLFHQLITTFPTLSLYHISWITLAMSQKLKQTVIPIKRRLVQFSWLDLYMFKQGKLQREHLENNLTAHVRGADLYLVRNEVDNNRFETHPGNHYGEGGFTFLIKLMYFPS